MESDSLLGVIYERGPAAQKGGLAHPSGPPRAPDSVAGDLLENGLSQSFRTQPPPALSENRHPRLTGERRPGFPAFALSGTRLRLRVSRRAANARGSNHRARAALGQGQAELKQALSAPSSKRGARRRLA